ncbi:MAG: hypothetical protein MUP67_06595 [Acidimicrobiia bacterium]|nr:hypothetical protein [Acidimicrobiia bacterium]
MTDDTAADQAERIRRLQERRGGGATAKPRATSRAKHPASASRIVAVGVTLASFFTVVTAFGIRQNATNAAVVPAPATAAPTPAVAAAPVAAIPAPTGATPAPVSAAPQAVASAAPAPQPAPVQTTTRGS